MRIDHVALYVSSLEDAKDFFIRYFNGVCGKMYHNPRTGLRTCFISFVDGSRLELMSRDEVSPSKFNLYRGGYIHIAFSVGSKTSVDELTDRLASDGYEIMSGPRMTGDGYYESCVIGVENNIIEITE